MTRLLADSYYVPHARTPHAFEFRCMETRACGEYFDIESDDLDADAPEKCPHCGCGEIRFIKDLGEI